MQSLYINQVGNNMNTPRTVKEIEYELEKFKKGYERYEKLRILNPKQFHDLYKKNLDESIPFDTLVDNL